MNVHVNGETLSEDAPLFGEVLPPGRRARDDSEVMHRPSYLTVLNRYYLAAWLMFGSSAMA